MTADVQLGSSPFSLTIRIQSIAKELTICLNMFNLWYCVLIPNIDFLTIPFRRVHGYEKICVNTSKDASLIRVSIYALRTRLEAGCQFKGTARFMGVCNA